MNLFKFLFFENCQWLKKLFDLKVYNYKGARRDFYWPCSDEVICQDENENMGNEKLNIDWLKDVT